MGYLKDYIKRVTNKASDKIATDFSSPLQVNTPNNSMVQLSQDGMTVVDTGGNTYNAVVGGNTFGIEAGLRMNFEDYFVIHDQDIQVGCGGIIDGLVLNFTGSLFHSAGHPASPAFSITRLMDGNTYNLDTTGLTIFNSLAFGSSSQEFYFAQFLRNGEDVVIGREFLNSTWNGGPSNYTIFLWCYLKNISFDSEHLTFTGTVTEGSVTIDYTTSDLPLTDVSDIPWPSMVPDGLGGNYTPTGSTFSNSNTQAILYVPIFSINSDGNLIIDLLGNYLSTSSAIAIYSSPHAGLGDFTGTIDSEGVFVIEDILNLNTLSYLQNSTAMGAFIDFAFSRSGFNQPFTNAYQTNFNPFSISSGLPLITKSYTGFKSTAGNSGAILNFNNTFYFASPYMTLSTVSGDQTTNQIHTYGVDNTFVYLTTNSQISSRDFLRATDSLQLTSFKYLTTMTADDTIELKNYTVTDLSHINNTLTKDKQVIDFHVLDFALRRH